MRNKLILVLQFLPLFLTAGNSLAAPDYCQNLKPFLLQSVHVSKSPNWFQRIMFDGSYVGFNEWEVNYILNMETQKLQKVPGLYDPVWTPDGHFLTTVNRTAGIEFHSAVPDEAEAPLCSDGTRGFYQSTAVLNSEEPISYRILRDFKGVELFIQDFTASDSKHLSKASEPLYICPDLQLSLPSMSKDGKFLAAYEVKSDVTKIYSIPDCKEIANLGIRTGKVDFNFESTKVAFHIVENGTSVNYEERAPNSWVSNIFIFDLASKVFKRITYNRSSNTHYYYPNFTKNGDLIFLRIKFRGDQSASSFIRVDPNELNVFRLQNDFIQTNVRYGLIALGSLVKEKCGQANEMNLEDLFFLSGGLSHSDCLSAAKDWERFKSEFIRPRSELNSDKEEATYDFDEVKDLEVEDLEKACGIFQSATAEDWQPNVQFSFNPFVPTCVSCHNAGSLGRAFFNPELMTAKQVERIRSKIRSEDEYARMPPQGVPWTQADLAALETYLANKE